MSRNIVVLAALVALSASSLDCGIYGEEEPGPSLPDTQRNDSDCVLDAPNVRLDECRLPQ